MPNKTLGLSKAERLCSKRLIEDLYLKGISHVVFPIRYTFIYVDNNEIPQSFPMQVLFSVARKNFKSAVKRNLFKRRMREAYRIHKEILYSALILNDKKITLSLVYIAKEELSYQRIESALKKILQQLSIEIPKNK